MTEDRGVLEVHFPPSATIGAVERQVALSFEDIELQPESVCLDLSATRYVEIATLQYLTAFITARRRQELTTRLRLPQGEQGLKVRHFLRRWQYSSALKDACGLKFSELVPEVDHKYFRGLGGDAGELYSGVNVTYNFDDGPVTFRYEAHRFFAFTTWSLNDYRDKDRLVHDVVKSWDVEPVMTVLNRHMRLPKNSRDDSRARHRPDLYLRSRVVFEAMVNAVRHPSASVIQTVSHLQSPHQKKVSFFTIVFWDDGESMLGTLRAALAADKEIRKEYPAHFDTRYLLTVKDWKGEFHTNRVIHSRDTPTLSSPNEELLLATAFPGVTRDIKGLGLVVHPDVRKESLDKALPGMGLYVLVDVVVGMFGGSVGFRTENLFLNINRRKPAEAEAIDYRVNVTRFNDKTPGFLGNMVTIRLPVGWEVES